MTHGPPRFATGPRRSIDAATRVALLFTFATLLCALTLGWSSVRVQGAFSSGRPNRLHRFSSPCAWTKGGRTRGEARMPVASSSRKPEILRILWIANTPSGRSWMENSAQVPAFSAVDRCGTPCEVSGSRRGLDCERVFSSRHHLAVRLYSASFWCVRVQRMDANERVETVSEPPLTDARDEQRTGLLGQRR